MKKIEREELAYNVWNSVYMSNIAKEDNFKSEKDLIKIILEIDSLEMDAQFTKKLIRKLNNTLADYVAYSLVEKEVV